MRVKEVEKNSQDDDRETIQSYVSARGSIDRKQLRRTGIDVADNESRGSPASRGAIKPRCDS